MIFRMPVLKTTYCFYYPVLLSKINKPMYIFLRGSQKFGTWCDVLLGIFPFSNIIFVIDMYCKVITCHKKFFSIN